MGRDEKAGFIWLWQEFGNVSNVSYCMFFRNESSHLSSSLILIAERFVPRGWPCDAKTFINTRAVGGDGKCFKTAGWRKNGRTGRGLLVLEKTLSGAGDGLL